ncbi:hypothetical protein Back11_57860 [Paenibacillus baekrokdamisoli]|uniref:Uncharacterized protein n=1 Tax=Paenibacillus baekrokdamisoli TaxID=1712516 RepID=A0A3G9JEV2_9BACL|nr:hypothetical protein [Paenibacillus baekrokdamisoli]MBB3072883.1 hypothetical protein [Paenibacillus baekrokdamisoli]BBH24441.1 hypothetical protein Back11_57860 [Paenibacillus baekrokdamisoli]
MNGELHHLMLLASFGNLYLLKNILEEPKHYKDNSHYLIKFIPEYKDKKHLFSLFSKSLKEYDTLSWMHDLRERKCKGIFIFNSDRSKDERITSAFVGGGRRWGLICQFDNFNELWIANWELEEKPPNTRWEISYNKLDFRENIKLKKRQSDLLDLSNQLRSALVNLSQLAHEIQEDFWRESFFDKGIQILDGIIIAEDQLSSIYSVEAQRIINTVYSSWVFGGMGSWNDSPPYSAQQHGKETEYNDFSNALYETMMDCIEGATNSVVSQR